MEEILMCVSLVAQNPNLSLAYLFSLLLFSEDLRWATSWLNLMGGGECPPTSHPNMHPLSATNDASNKVVTNNLSLKDMKIDGKHNTLPDELDAKKKQKTSTFIEKQQIPLALNSLQLE